MAPWSHPYAENLSISMVYDRKQAAATVFDQSTMRKKDATRIGSCPVEHS